MEAAKIDWKRVESIFVEDKLYENINAPKWVDFLAPEPTSVGDDSWFCRPDCNHPKTAEDFLRTTPTSKLPISADRSKTPLGSWNLRSKLGNTKLKSLSVSPLNMGCRDARFKRRGQNQLSPKSNEDCENQSPNFSTPLNHQGKSMIKSSTERKKPADGVLREDEPPRLKSTLSARNLFGGKDILSQIGEFCNELKKLATIVREREEDDIKLKEDDQVPEAVATGGPREVLREIDVKEREKPMLLEAGTGKSEGIGKKGVKEQKSRKKRLDNAENIPVPLNLANVNCMEEERLLQIRINPPSPQCFSATRASTKNINAKDSKSRFMERGILQEVNQNKKEMPTEEIEDKNKSFSIVEEKEARALNVFWFLKPCTMSS